MLFKREKALKNIFTIRQEIIKDDVDIGIWDRKFKDNNPWIYSASEDRVYQKKEIYYQIWITDGHRSRTLGFKKSERRETETPQDGRPITVKNNEVNLKVISMSQFDMCNTKESEEAYN